MHHKFPGTDPGFRGIARSGSPPLFKMIGAARGE
jgi:hypothetical protein